MRTLANLIFACLAAASVFSEDREADSPRNVLFILADDLGWADTTLYGHTDFYETPHLERLAARGMTFDRAYAASPLCSPTRSSILTGLHPARTGLTAPNCHTPGIVLEASVSERAPPHRKQTRYEAVSRLHPKYETLSERLAGAGYATAHFGKWHLGKSPYSPLENGFEIDIPHWHGPGPAGSFVAPWKFPDFEEKYPKEHIEDRMGDEIVAFLENHIETRDDRPFFANYWQFSVHAPFDAKEDLIAKYRSRVDPDDEQRSPTYAAMIQSLDDNVGKMLDALDRLELADDTIIIFFSDNGGNMYNEVDGTTPTSNRPLRGGKGNNWDGGVRVPCIVVWPGATEPGSRSDVLLTSTDFHPTLLEMLEMEPPARQRFDGVSLVPALRGGTIERGPIFTFFPHSTNVPDTLPPSASVYEDDWKLLRLLHHGVGGKHEHRLFHLSTDIGERENLAETEAERVGAMAETLDGFLEETGAVYPKPNPDYDPATARLFERGIRPGKDIRLTAKEGTLHARTEARNANFTIRLDEPLPTGSHVFRIALRSDSAGRIALRWSEKGVKPPYFRDRLVFSIPHPEAEADADAETVEMGFEAAHPVTSFRVDFEQPPGRTAIEKITVDSDGASRPLWE